MAIVLIKGKIMLDKQDLALLREATPEAALATLRNAGADVVVEVVTHTGGKSTIKEE